MSQISRLSRGVREVLRNLPSAFLNAKRVSSTYLGNDLVKKSNLLKLVPSVFKSSGFTNPHPPLLPPSLPSATYNHKEHGTSNSKNVEVKNSLSKKVFKEKVKILRVLFDYNDPHNHVLHGLKVLSTVLKVWKVLCPYFEFNYGVSDVMIPQSLLRLSIILKEDEKAIKKAEQKILKLLLDYDDRMFADHVLLDALEFWKSIVCDLEVECIKEWTTNKDKYDDEDKSPIPLSVIYGIEAYKVLMEDFDDPDDMIKAIKAHVK